MESNLTDVVNLDRKVKNVTVKELCHTFELSELISHLSKAKDISVFGNNKRIQFVKTFP